MAGYGEPLARVVAEIARGKPPSILATRFDPDTGEDLFGRDQLLREIRRCVLHDTPPIFGQTVFDGPSVTLAEVLDAAREVSLVAPRRLVLVRGSRLAPGSEVHETEGGAEGKEDGAGRSGAGADERGGESAQLAVLERYLAKGASTACIVFLGCPWDGRRKIHKALLDAATVVDVSRPDPRHMPSWIEARVHEQGAQIDPDATAVLAYLRGNDTMRMSAEIEKLRIHAGPAGRITREDVLALVGASEAASAWDLVDAMADGDPGRAVRTLRRLLDEGEAAPMIVGAIAARLRQMIVLRDERTIGRPNEAARRIVFPGRSVYFADDLARKAARFPAEALLSALASLHDVDRRTKSSSMESGAWIEQWLLSAFKTTSSVRS